MNVTRHGYYTNEYLDSIERNRHGLRGRSIHLISQPEMRYDNRHLGVQDEVEFLRGEPRIVWQHYYEPETLSSANQRNNERSGYLCQSITPAQLKRLQGKGSTTSPVDYIVERTQEPSSMAFLPKCAHKRLFSKFFDYLREPKRLFNPMDDVFEEPKYTDVNPGFKMKRNARLLIRKMKGRSYEDYDYDYEDNLRNCTANGLHEEKCPSSQESLSGCLQPGNSKKRLFESRRNDMDELYPESNDNGTLPPDGYFQSSGLIIPSSWNNASSWFNNVLTSGMKRPDEECYDGKIDVEEASKSNLSGIVSSCKDIKSKWNQPLSDVTFSKRSLVLIPSRKKHGSRGNERYSTDDVRVVSKSKELQPSILKSSSENSRIHTSNPNSGNIPQFSSFITGLIHKIKLLRSLFAPIDVVAERFPAVQTFVIFFELFVFFWLLYEVSLLIEAICMIVRTFCAPMIAFGRLMNKIV